jgi:hypothetical protein
LVATTFCFLKGCRRNEEKLLFSAFTLEGDFGSCALTFDLAGAPSLGDLDALEPTFPELSLPLEDEALPELRALPEPPPELTWEEPEPE